MPDIRPNRDVNSLCPCVRELWDHLRNLLEDEEEPIEIITTSVLRTQTEQDALVKGGVSWTRNSMHLPQPPNGLSLAFDIVSKECVRVDPKNWAPWHPHWKVIGQNARAIGLQWGVWFKDKKTGALRNVDPGHCYLRKCECPPKQSARADAIVEGMK